ncbi:MAG: CotH kinase family protein, partial [Myxococcales bacterium]|nr:CotH kinase family protein [Myxococcales bacterium]
MCSDVYDPDRILHVELEIAPWEWEALQEEHDDWEAREAAGLPLKPWHPVATFRADGEEIHDASVRLKGNPCCSWTSDKLQLVVAFDQQDPDGRFKHLRKLTLDAPPYDPSLLRDRVALSYFRDAGFAASCANHATVHINGQYYGIYANIETVDQELLRREFPDTEHLGNLYKWDYDLGRFRKRNNAGEAADDLRD